MYNYTCITLFFLCICLYIMCNKNVLIITGKNTQQMQYTKQAKVSLYLQNFTKLISN